MTGNQNSVTLYNINTTEEGNGIIFDGKSSYAQLNLQQELTFPMTIDLKLSCLENKVTIIYIEPSSKIALAIGNNNYFTCTIGESTNTFQIPDDFFNGNVKHIVLIYNSLTNIQAYVNGTELTKNSTESSLTSLVDTISYFGRREKGDYFKGILYEFNIYRKALNENEINEQYNYTIKIIRNKLILK